MYALFGEIYALLQLATSGNESTLKA